MRQDDAQQLRVQQLLRQMLLERPEQQQQQQEKTTTTSDDASSRASSPIGKDASEEHAIKRATSYRLDSVRVLRKTLRDIDYKLNWIAQLDLVDTCERVLASESEQHSIDWRLVHDCTSLLIDCVPRLPYVADAHTSSALFARLVRNLGHPRSEVRRASLLLINVYMNCASTAAGSQRRASMPAAAAADEQPNRSSSNDDNDEEAASKSANDFDKYLQLFIECGLANARNEQAQRGAVLALPLLLGEQVCEAQNLEPLVRCLGEQLTEANEQLFYSLCLAMQRLESALGERRFRRYLRHCSPEAVHLYSQASSRNNSLAEVHQNYRRQKQRQAQAAAQSPERQVTFEQQQQQQEQQQQHDGSEESSSPISCTRKMSSASESTASPPPPSCASRNTQQQQQRQQAFVRASDVSSTCSSAANLVDPANYMSAAALDGHPLDGHVEPAAYTAGGLYGGGAQHACTGLAINDLGVCCSPTPQLGNNELKFGIFPRHLIRAALHAPRYSDRLEALERIMCMVRESPINHLAILMSYFDAFLDEFVARLIMEPQGDYKIELVALDLLETLVIKTKVSTMPYVNAMVALLVRCLADSRQAIFRDNTVRVVHKMMAYLPPQHVLDALMEHKHHKAPVVREECVNRCIAAVLHYGGQEFNLIKLCYHVLPMLADQQPRVRLAALECIATLAHALGPERIGSLLTAAEAVQTGCDYDGLLDAIHARLVRRALPKCQPDGSIRYVLKPLLTSAHADHRQAADVRWVLESPAAHVRQLQKQQREQRQKSAKKPQAGQAQKHQHQHLHQHHRLGAYSPPDAGALEAGSASEALRRRRSSFDQSVSASLSALAAAHDRAESPDARHAHHHHAHAGSHKAEQQQQQQRRAR